jgi:hypothetical protein
VQGQTFYLGILMDIIGDTMEIAVALLYIVLGVILGAVGQGARAVIGIKKAADEAAANEKKIDEWFDWKRFLFSIVIGAIAGCLAAILLLEAPVNQELMLGLVAAGYAGTDFIEGLISKYTPAAKPPCTTVTPQSTTSSSQDKEANPS